MKREERDIIDAVAWCRKHNALVRFESNGSVSVRMNGTTRKRETLFECVLALEKFWSTGRAP